MGGGVTMFDWLRRLSSKSSQPERPAYTEQDVQMLGAMAQRMADAINESMQIANQSKNVETRRSRIRVARDRLADLQKMASEHPFLALTNLVDVERSIAELERETHEMAPDLQPSPTLAVLGDPDALHPHEVTPDHPLAGSFDGMRFSATFNIRTPLRLLRRDGQVVPLGTRLADDFDRSMGHWFPKPKSLDDLLGTTGLDEMAEDRSRRASSAGPVKPSEYLPFLIAVREAVEDPSDGTSGRMARLHKTCARPAFVRFVAAEGGAGRMSDRFFPPVLSLIGGLPSGSRDCLRDMHLNTVAKLNAASDATLLAVKGVGPSNLAAIRAFCADFRGDVLAERTVDVEI